MIGNLHLLRRAAPVAVLAALAAIPTEAVASLPVMCMWRTLLHLECPGCGMTRALSNALHGHLHAALACNRGVVLVLPAAFIVIIRDLHALCSPRRRVLPVQRDSSRAVVTHTAAQWAGGYSCLPHPMSSTRSSAAKAKAIQNAVPTQGSEIGC
jgi:hypothetical protein